MVSVNAAPVMKMSEDITDTRQTVQVQHSSCIQRNHVVIVYIIRPYIPVWQ